MQPALDRLGLPTVQANLAGRWTIPGAV